MALSPVRVNYPTMRGKLSLCGFERETECWLCLEQAKAQKCKSELWVNVFKHRVHSNTPLLHICLLRTFVVLFQSLPVTQFPSQRPEVNKSKHALFRVLPHGQHTRYGISETEGSEPHLLMEKRKNCSNIVT